MKRHACRAVGLCVLVTALALALHSPARAIFSSPVTLSGDGVPAFAPRIAVDGKDNTLAVWTESDNGVDRVRAAFRPAGGDLQTLGFLSSPDQASVGPQIAFDEHDNALAVWAQYDGDLGRVYAAFRPAGGSFGAPQRISGAEADATYYEPRVAADESATVVWTRIAGEDLNVQAAFKAKNGAFGAPRTISGSEGGYEPRVALDDRGRSLAVWTAADGASVHSAFRPRTGDWAGSVQLSAAGEGAFSPRIAVDKTNAAIAVWTGVDGRIHASHRPEGGAFDAPEPVSSETGTAFDPDIAIDESDNAIVAWTRTTGLNARIETSTRPRGGTFGAPQAISPAGQDAFEPRIAADDSATVVWSEALGQDALRVHGAFRQKGGAFGGPQILSEPGNSSFEPDVTMDSHGNVAAVWTQQLSSLSLVQISFRPRAGNFGESASISAADSGAFEPQLATDRLGNTIAVWSIDHDLGDETNPSWIEAAFAPAGGEFGAPERISNPDNLAYQPRVAFERDGDATVAWTEDDGGRLEVHAAFHVADNGWVPAAQLSPADVDAFDPQVAAGPGSVVVWSQSDGGSGLTAEAAVKPDSASFLSPQTVSGPGEEAHGPDVAVGQDGTAVVTWYLGFGDGVVAALGEVSAAGFEAGATISPPGMAASEPQAAVDDRGNAIVVWTGGQGALIQAAFRPRRAGFQDAQDIAADNVLEPQVAFDESGNAHAVWTRFAGEDGTIETAVRPLHGTFGSPQVVSGTGEALSHFTPRISADDSVAVVWTAATADGGLRVQSAYRPKDGVFGPVQTLTDRMLLAFEPQVAVDERGNVRALWTQAEPTANSPATIQSAFRPRA